MGRLIRSLAISDLLNLHSSPLPEVTRWNAKCQSSNYIVCEFLWQAAAPSLGTLWITEHILFIFITLELFQELARQNPNITKDAPFTFISPELFQELKMKIKTHYFLLYHNITVDFDSKGHQRHYKKKKVFLPGSDMLAWLALTAAAFPAWAASPGLPPAVGVVSGLRPSQCSQPLQCLGSYSVQWAAASPENPHHYPRAVL